MKSAPFIDLTSKRLQPELEQLQLLRFEAIASSNIGSNRDEKNTILILNTIQHIVSNKNQFCEVKSDTIEKLKSLSLTLRKKIFQPKWREEKDELDLSDAIVDVEADSDMCDAVEDVISSHSSSADLNLFKNKSHKAVKTTIVDSNHPAPFFSDAISAENIQTLLLDQRVLLLK